MGGASCNYKSSETFGNCIYICGECGGRCSAEKTPTSSPVGTPTSPPVGAPTNGGGSDDCTDYSNATEAKNACCPRPDQSCGFQASTNNGVCTYTCNGCSAKCGGGGGSAGAKLGITNLAVCISTVFFI